MPAINPRQECGCSSRPLATGRVQEQSANWRAYAGLLLAALAILVPAHYLLWQWGWLTRILLVGLDVVPALIPVVYVIESRSQREHGLGYVRLEDSSFTLGRTLSMQVGSTRGLAGLAGVSASLSCIDAVYEERQVQIQDSRGTERQKVCYVVWAERRHVERKDLPAQGELRLQFALPLESDFASPVGEHIERYWEVEVTRHGAGSHHFRVLVSPPEAATAQAS